MLISQQLSQLLEKNPKQFLAHLKNPDNNEIFKKWIANPKSVMNWFSPALTQLVLLVGNLSEYWVNKSYFFGENTIISEEMGIEIFDLLMEFEPNLEDTDYYEETLLDIVTKYEDKKVEWMRLNNEKFMSYVKDKLNSQ
tara:strand:- start:451 stop:867 length:417 start_codon:yes stop_codon:yes gene_type:complete